VTGARGVAMAARRATALMLAASLAAAPAAGATPEAPPCIEDAMIVFDGSGSMSGTDRFGIASVVTRIEKVRTALRQVLPEVTPARRIGLITFGPGPYNKCDNIRLELEPRLDAFAPIMGAVDKLNPAGRTPLTAAVKEAAKVLNIEERPAVIVLVTDGEETCGGSPCAVAEDFRLRGKQTTVHVIGYRVKDYSWTGDMALQSRCLADKTGGLYISVETTDELIAALRKTLACPYLTQLWRPRG
jgi:Ca-activated chloride channel family protein